MRRASAFTCVFYRPGVDTAFGIAILVVSVVSIVAVLVAFVWAARKDGQADEDVQRRTGIKRRTRLGP
jgi:hypothetical protein